MKDQYTKASPVRITNEDGDQVIDALSPQEHTTIARAGLLAAFNGRERGLKVIPTPTPPRIWGMTPTKKEREDYHRARIEELRKEVSR